MVSIWTPILILSSLPVSSPASGSPLCFQILWRFFFERKTKDSIAYIPLSGIITPIKVLVSGYNIVQMSCFVVWFLQGLGGKSLSYTQTTELYICVCIDCFGGGFFHQQNLWSWVSYHCVMNTHTPVFMVNLLRAHSIPGDCVSARNKLVTRKGTFLPSLVCGSSCEHWGFCKKHNRVIRPFQTLELAVEKLMQCYLW